MAAFEALMFVFPLAFIVASLVGWIVFLVAVWNSMRAHETIADNATEAVGILRSRTST